MAGRDARNPAVGSRRIQITAHASISRPDQAVCNFEQL
jgi:hypothetical protein